MRGAKEVLIKYWGSDSALIIDSIDGGFVEGRHVTLDDNCQTPFKRELTSDLIKGNPNGFFMNGVFHKISDFSKE